VPHLHVTLTTDDLLWPFSFADRPLLKVLLKTAAQACPEHSRRACPEHSRRAVRELAQEPYPGVRIGMIYTVHTGGRDLGFKPHVHLVMTKGGLKDGEWVEIESG